MNRSVFSLNPTLSAVALAAALALTAGSAPAEGVGMQGEAGGQFSAAGQAGAGQPYPPYPGAVPYNSPGYQPARPPVSGSGQSRGDAAGRGFSGAPAGDAGQQGEPGSYRPLDKAAGKAVDSPASVSAGDAGMLGDREIAMSIDDLRPRADGNGYQYRTAQSAEDLERTVR